MIKVALIGNGSFGSKILDKLKQISDIHLVYILSSADDWRTVSNVDWVIISTPTELHYEQSKYFIQNGINVFCEKPCTLSYSSTKELIDLSIQKNVKLYIDDVLSYENIDISSKSFVYKKSSVMSNNIVDRIVYHHLYLLYTPTTIPIIDNFVIKTNELFKKQFKLSIDGLEYEFDYDLQSNETIHNVVCKTNVDALETMLTAVFSNNVSFELNHDKTLFASELSDQLKKYLYGTVAVVGAGIYGITAALKLKDAGFNVDLFEREDDILKAASGINQYRIHRGYHYPRSIDTIQSCRDNESLFIKFYKNCILDNNIKHLYSISKNNSLTTAEQYLQILDENNLEWKLHDTINGCSVTIEANEQLYNPNELRKICINRLYSSGINVKLNTEWNSAYKSDYEYVVYATYSNLNSVTNEQINYQFELCEKPLFKLPDTYKNTSIVIMDGPFMCFDPYADTEYHLGGNVVHAIHLTNIGPTPNIPYVYKEYLNKGIIKNPKYTNVSKFIQSAKEFFPDIENAEHIGSMYTIRTVLPDSESTDSRPTIVRKLNKNEFVIFSGKIVNCIDAANKLIKMIYE